MLDKQQVISAQVVLRSASGKVPDSATGIVAKTIKEYAPSAEAVHIVRQGFAAAGFQVGPLVGNSFSITAPLSTFESVFHTQIRRRGDGGIEAVQADGSGTYELPLDALSPAIRQHLAAVTFTPPPAFGPGGSY
jgi:hypothetical protein